MLAILLFSLLLFTENQSDATSGLKRVWIILSFHQRVMGGQNDCLPVAPFVGG